MPKAPRPMRAEPELQAVLSTQLRGGGNKEKSYIKKSQSSHEIRLVLKANPTSGLERWLCHCRGKGSSGNGSVSSPARRHFRRAQELAPVWLTRRWDTAPALGQPRCPSGAELCSSSSSSSSGPELCGCPAGRQHWHWSRCTPPAWPPFSANCITQPAGSREESSVWLKNSCFWGGMAATFAK